MTIAVSRGALLIALLALSPLKIKRGVLVKSSQQHSAVLKVTDTSAFESLVKAATASTSTPIAVDPVPLRNDVAASDVTAETRANVSPSELSARRALLQELGIPEADGNRPKRCTTIMVPYSPHDLHRGCPSTLRYIASFANPIKMADTVPPSGSFDAERWTTRSILAMIGPHGVSLELRDYILRHEGAGWAVVSMRVVGYNE